jgi:hypothetical protein
MGWLTRDRTTPPAPTRREALDCIPVKNRTVREERLENGDVLVLYPVTVRPWMAALARWLGAGDAPPRTAKLQLDRLGSGVWAMLDGQTPLRRIAAAFAETHRLERKEAEVAVTQFIRELGRRGLIGLRRNPAPGCRPDGSPPGGRSPARREERRPPVKRP